MSKFAETKSFIEACWAEMHKVTWPDWEQTRGATIVIIVFVMMVSAVIWGMDVFSRNVINGIMSLFGA